MPSSGPSTLNAGVNDSSSGTVAWTNPNNAIASDGTNASVHVPDGGLSQYLQAHHTTSISIPAGSVIKGMVVDIDRSANFNSNIVGSKRQIVDNSIILVQNGTTHSSSRATGNIWPTTTTRATYGTPTDTWGLTWTSTQFATDGFGVDIQILGVDDVGTGVTAFVDYVQVTVYYSTAGKPPTTQVIYIGS
jgi:hypothetical protein